MKNIILVLLFFASFISNAQTGDWTWMNGDSTSDPSGVFGTQGIPSATNTPPGFYEAVGWEDHQGNLWLFTGSTFSNKYSDLWMYSVSTNQWTWVKGPGTADQPAVMGVRGVSSPLNNPGVETWCSATWVDKSGDFWLFGGAGNNGFMNNALWRYNTASNEWTWMKGDTSNRSGVYGIQGVPDTANYPAGRFETNASWVDNNGDLWLLGGNCNAIPLLNDLWRYNIASNTWTWMKGSQAPGQPGIYGTMGVADTANTPGGRMVYAKFKDLNGDLWIFGGNDNTARENDWWKFNIASNEWTWMAGSSAYGDSGQYGIKCTSAVGNTPQATWENKACWTDTNGGFWLYGGFSNNSYQLSGDFFHFDPLSLKGTWIGGPGPAIINQPATYGSKGIASATNYPGARLGSVSWLDKSNRLWMFGGWTPGLTNGNDMWSYIIDPNCPQSIAPPVADFLSASTTICANDCINFNDLSTNATSWQWTFAGAIDSTSTSENPQNICYQAAGIYNVTLIASNSGGSDSVTVSNYITVNPAPPTPTVKQHYDTLFCSTDPTYTSYQWYDSTAIIIGATDSFYVAALNGNYNVKVTNEDGCSTAVGINIILGIKNYASGKLISLYPNPVGKEFAVYGLQFTGSYVEILNVFGQVCSQSKIVNRKSEIEVDVSLLASGIYFVRIENENGTWVNKIVKQ